MSTEQRQGDVADLVRTWTKGTFVLRSGVYAGRGVSLADLDSQKLEAIYRGIKSHVGDVAASNFVRFVNQLDDLSASAFVVAFNQFWTLGCTNPFVEQHAADRYQVDSRGLLQGFAAAAELLFGRRTSEENIKLESEALRFGFIRAHLREIPKEERRKTLWEGMKINVAV